MYKFFEEVLDRQAVSIHGAMVEIAGMKMQLATLGDDLRELTGHVQACTAGQQKLTASVQTLLQVAIQNQHPAPPIQLSSIVPRSPQPGSQPVLQAPSPPSLPWTLGGVRAS
ncbi:hypothetical protein PybrP1_006279 [[Pythium] brassicae (nom. inval.)]|nr:hypothetical protein PybrP1_006279 [[Pythium] brassicae (nom. inval.)]